MNSAQSEHFYNEGFGWICKKCEQTGGGSFGREARLLKEGEAEEKIVELSTKALARWADRSRGLLECPGCGMIETLKDNE